MESEAPFTHLVDRTVISAEAGIIVGHCHYERICQHVLADRPDSHAAVKSDDGIIAENGRYSYQRYEPEVVVLVEIQLQDLIVRQPVLFGKIPECPAVEPAYALVRGEPDKPLPVLQALINDGARQPVLYSELPVGEFLAAAAEAGEYDRKKQ
jgi:hypothetical protein